MKTLYLDCSMGAAGDMLAAALLELLPDPDAVVADLNALGIPGVEFVRERVSRCGIVATHLSVLVDGGEEEVDEGGHHHHHHHHNGEGEPDGHHHHHHGDGEDGHHHHHHHSSLADINGIIAALPLPSAAMGSARKVYALLAAAEGRVHGRNVEMVHFHEVGAMDAVADIAACCLIMARLAPERIVASPVHVGFGSVRCAHGVLPVPAPATACLLEGVPTYSDGTVRGELCTPTGAALLRHFVSEYGPMPLMRVESVGYGAGKKEFDRANVVRSMLGEGGLAPSAFENEVCQIACNIDDMTGEELAFAADAVREAGALDVCLLPALMKKGRPGTIMLALCGEERRESVIAAIFRNTSTLGIRESRVRRAVLGRGEEKVATPLGEMRLKKASGYGVKRSKFEYEDLAAVARERGISLAEALAALKGGGE